MGSFCRREVLKQRIAPELGRSKDIFREYALLHQLRHPNVLECFGYFWERDTRSLFLVLEYAPSRAGKGNDLGNHFYCRQVNGAVFPNSVSEYLQHNATNVWQFSINFF